MVKLTNDMLGAYEVIAAGMLGSHFHPELGVKVRDLIIGDWQQLDNVSYYFNTADFLKMLLFNNEMQQIEVHMVKLDIKNHNDHRYYQYSFDDGTVFDDYGIKYEPIAIIEC